MRLLDDGAVRQLAAKRAAVAAFPFLALKTTAKPGCCGRPGRRAGPDFQRIKMAIARLGRDRQLELLGLLELTAARLIYKNGQDLVDIRIGNPG